MLQYEDRILSYLAPLSLIIIDLSSYLASNPSFHTNASIGLDRFCYESSVSENVSIAATTNSGSSAWWVV
jgi:hypothetical protein